MPFSTYESAIATAKRALSTLDHCLDEAEKHPNAAQLPTARLSEDMKPLTFQVYMATQKTEQMTAKLLNRPPVVLPQDIGSFVDMHARIKFVLQTLDGVDPEAVNSCKDAVTNTELGPGFSRDISASGFTYGVTIPNIFFHVSIAYAILRKEGVALGKKDYLSSFIGPFLA
jgi:hypothetical protein